MRVETKDWCNKSSKIVNRNGDEIMDRKWEYEKPYIEIMFCVEDDVITLSVGNIGTDPNDPWGTGAQ